MDPRAIPPEVWEALCRRCGKCCTEKISIDDVVYLTRKPCRFLDPETRGCTAYPERFRVEPDCVSVVEGLPIYAFPADCPYILGVPGYVPPVDRWDDPRIDRVIEEVLGDV
jgi:uncharacterized cysteine cluster protein YcgN (CxxCxxCC family)